MFRHRFGTVLVVFVAALTLGSAGCINGLGGIFDFVDGRVSFDGDIRVEVFNDSDFEVIPDVRFDDDTDVRSIDNPDDFLDIGELLPGEFVQFDFDCDELGVIFSDETEVFFFGEFVGVAEASFPIINGLEFDCADLIQIRFVGADDFFDVETRVNGFRVD